MPLIESFRLLFVMFKNSLENRGLKPAPDFWEFLLLRAMRQMPLSLLQWFCVYRLLISKLCLQSLCLHHLMSHCLYFVKRF